MVGLESAISVAVGVDVTGHSCELCAPISLPPADVGC